jgi:hypothetical protein
MSPIDALSTSDVRRGEVAARRIWEDADGVDEINDPRTPEFSSAFLTGLANALAASPGVIKKVMRGAAAAAEDLNVEPFQGLTEVIQNADDLGATEVRFALRKTIKGRQLLIVHNGQPVACQHVLGMALPFLTTKTNRPDQRGRFGIGLKTLKRIATRLSIHSAPYHFSGDQLSLEMVAAEKQLPGFYDPALDTLVVLDLKDLFDQIKFEAWFGAWDEDGLIFLSSVSSFRWCDPQGKTIDSRSLRFGTWRDVPLTEHNRALTKLSSREVHIESRSWTVWRAFLTVPKDLHPAHKIRSDSTHISVAASTGPDAGALHVGFKTRVPVGLSFSIDAHFDPSTAREALIENTWNTWLINRCGDVLAEISSGLLVTRPAQAWRLVPLSTEFIGNETDRWLRGSFAAAFKIARDRIGREAKVCLDAGYARLENVAYESKALSGLLTDTDIESLIEGVRALPNSARDVHERWRAALDDIGVSTRVGTKELLLGFVQQQFQNKAPAWWVKAARILVEIHADEELFGAPFWLSDDGRGLACLRNGETARPLVLGGEVSAFELRWKLFDHLHPAYSRGRDGNIATTWLTENAAFSVTVDVESELAAFAERFKDHPLEVSDDDLRELRNCFDELRDRQAEELGRNIGKVILLDGFVYIAGKVSRQKVSPSSSYLCKTLDSDSPHWPTAAAGVPELKWIAARYEDQLRVAAPGQRLRRRKDGKVSRGPRKFLMLLGAEIAPRLQATERVYWGEATRVRELIAAGAEYVERDYVSPDLGRVLASFSALSRKELRVRSPALFKALARNWQRLYANRRTVPSMHTARKYAYERAQVTATWLVSLQDTKWVANSRGGLVKPSGAVVKTPETQTLYDNDSFAIGIGPDDFDEDVATSLGLITAVRVSDLISLLRRQRDGSEPVVDSDIQQIYRNIATRVPKTISWNTRIGDLNAQELRSQFSEGVGLVHVEERTWRKPSELLRGKDIFHDRKRFVRGGSSCAALWELINVREPSLDDCLRFLKDLPGRPYDSVVQAILIDVYRYVEPLLEGAERRQRDRLRNLPLYCDNGWHSGRPTYLVEDQELRAQLAKALPGQVFWTPPCDLRELPSLVAQTNVTRVAPSLQVADDRDAAQERGYDSRTHFVRAVNHLSDELARNDSRTRQQLSIGWDDLRSLSLFVYPKPVAIWAKDEHLSSTPIAVELQALVTREPLEFHVWEEALSRREYGGHAIASLFPPDSRRAIEAEWVVAWQESRGAASEAMRLASDEEHAEAVRERAAKINAVPKRKVSVSAPIGQGAEDRTRKLKLTVGPIMGATVVAGSAQKQVRPSAATRLRHTPPQSKEIDPASRSAPTAYTQADLEQRAWELLVQALETSAEEELVDFRSRHGVGADGVIDWKIFVEMKATGRGPQSAIEMSNAEYERAKERGKEFILALVSGLEDGYRDEVRLILDPANRTTVRPLNGVRLVGLTEAPSIVISFENASSHGQPAEE